LKDVATRAEGIDEHGATRDEIAPVALPPHRFEDGDTRIISMMFEMSLDGSAQP